MKEQMVNAIIVLAPKGYLTGGDETESLQQRLIEAVNEQVPAVVIDLTDVEHLGSVGLALIISAHSRYVRSGKRLVLAGVRKEIENIFVVTKLSLVFDVYSTVNQAVRELTERFGAQSSNG